MIISSYASFSSIRRHFENRYYFPSVDFRWPLRLMHGFGCIFAARHEPLFYDAASIACLCHVISITLRLAIDAAADIALAERR
jgi:hypothetical protein